MLSNFLSKTRPINYLSIFLLLFCFFILSIFSVDKLELSVVKLLKIGATILALLFMVLMMNFVVQKNRLTKDNSYTIFIFVLLLGMLPITMSWSFVFASNLFLLITLRRVYSFSNNSRIAIKIFDASFWLGISALLYPPAILFWLVILIGMSFYSKLNFKNILNSLLGVSIPIFLFYVYCFTFDQLPFFNNLFNFNFSNDYTNYGNLKFLLALTIIVSLLIWSTFSVTLELYKVSTKNQIKWFLLLFNLMVATVISFSSYEKNGSELMFLFFPTSIILANYLQKEKDNLFKNSVLLLLLFISFGIYFL